MSDLFYITEELLGGKVYSLSHKMTPLQFFVCLFSFCSDSRLAVPECFSPVNFWDSRYVLIFSWKILQYLYIILMISDSPCIVFYYKITNYICRCFTGCCLTVNRSRKSYKSYSATNYEVLQIWDVINSLSLLPSLWSLITGKMQDGNMPC